MLLAENRANDVGLVTDSIDLAPELVGASRRRAQFEPANWWAVAQCPSPGELMTTGDKLIIGVIRPDERTPLIIEASDLGSLDRLACDEG